LYYQSIAKPIMFNYSSVGVPINLSISSTLDHKKQFTLPFGDTVQLTLKIFKHDDEKEMNKN
jgi:hypothetical protein